MLKAVRVLLGVATIVKVLIATLGLYVVTLILTNKVDFFAVHAENLYLSEWTVGLLGFMLMNLVFGILRILLNRNLKAFLTAPVISDYRLNTNLDGLDLSDKRIVADRGSRDMVLCQRDSYEPIYDLLVLDNRIYVRLSSKGEKSKVKWNKLSAFEEKAVRRMYLL